MPRRGWGMGISRMPARGSGGGGVPSFAVVDDDLGLVIEATFSTTATDLVVDVTAPPAYVGTYLVALADLTTGPVNIIAPNTTGTVGVGNVVTASSGIWVFEISDGTPTISRQWVRDDGSAIDGETAATYTQQSSDRPLGVNVRETAVNFAGERSVTDQFVAAQPLASLTFGVGTRLSPNSGQTTSRKVTWLGRIYWTDAIVNNVQLFGDFQRAGVWGQSGGNIVVSNRRNGGTSFGSSVFTPVGAPVSFMVAGDFDGGLSGGKTFDLWINGSSRATSTSTNPTWAFDNPFNDTGAGIGYPTNTSFPRAPVLHYGFVWSVREAFLDPAVHWSSFFNPDNTMKDIGAAGIVGGVTPDIYCTLLSMLSGTNLGTGTTMTLTGTPTEGY